MNIKPALIALPLVLLSASAANAEMTAGEFLDSLKVPEQRYGSLIIASSVYSGVSWVNSVLMETGGKPYFCPPEHMAMSPEQVVHILRTYLKGEPKGGGYPLGLMIVYSMGKTFPCPE